MESFNSLSPNNVWTVAPAVLSASSTQVSRTGSSATSTTNTNNAAAASSLLSGASRLSGFCLHPQHDPTQSVST